MSKKIVFLIYCLYLAFFGLSQSVTAPPAASYPQSTANQNVDGFSTSGFNPSSTLLITIGLINPPAGTTLRLNTTAGITASTGYSLTSNFTRISFTGTQSNVNNVLASLRINTGSVPGNVYIAVTATENPVGYFYLPSNGHFYRPMNWPSGVSGGDAAYLNIKSQAASQSFKGQTGYLVTVTSQDEQDFIQANVPGSNILIALTDRLQEGIWRWDAGPESGTIIKTANSGGNVSGQYNNWCSGEPNNWGSGENYTVTKWGEGNCWNDFGPPATSFPGSVSGYVVEFGTWSDPGNQTFTDFYTGFVTHQISCIPATTPSSPAGNNGSRTNEGIVTISATPPLGSTVDWYTNPMGGNILSGGIGTTTFTTPPISSTTTYYAQSRNSSTGCVSSTRTAVIATVNYPVMFTYSGQILNINNTGSAGIEVKLLTKTKSSLEFSVTASVITNSSGNFNISTELDTALYDFRIIIENITGDPPNLSDVIFFNQKILSQIFMSSDYYRMNTNGDSRLTISDIYLIYQKINGNAWPSGVPPYRLFTQQQWITISSSSENLASTFPGLQTVTLTSPISGGNSIFYLVKTGKIN